MSCWLDRGYSVCVPSLDGSVLDLNSEGSDDWVSYRMVGFELVRILRANNQVMVMGHHVVGFRVMFCDPDGSPTPEGGGLLIEVTLVRSHGHYCCSYVLTLAPVPEPPEPHVPMPCDPKAFSLRFLCLGCRPLACGRVRAGFGS